MNLSIITDAVWVEKVILLIMNSLFLKESYKIDFLLTMCWNLRLLHKQYLCSLLEF